MCREGLKRFSQASSYQAQAEWLVLQHTDCPFSIKHRMYRVKGIWFAAQRRFNEARRCFADDVSQSLDENGFQLRALKIASGGFRGGGG